MEREIALDDVSLPADLVVPDDARGIVIFAHGSGSSRKSPRNRQVAAGLHEARLATLLFDLLTGAEARDRRNVFDIGLLATRMVAAVDRVGVEDGLRGLPVGLFGASTGAAAALDAAAARHDQVGAVVSRGGRPDLASALPEVIQPVLLVVGGDDTDVIDMNRAAGRELADHDLVLVPGAGHLFEGPGELEQVTALAAGWFEEHLRGGC